MSNNYKQKTKEILEKYKEHEGAVPIVGIANDLGIEVFETRDFEGEQSGAIVENENGSFFIYVKESDPWTRKKFTIAHEIAHYLEHQDFFKEKKEHVSLYRQPTHNGFEGRIVKMELEANDLAADLLMPKKVFKKIWRKAKTVSEVAKFFEVSQSAVTWRGIKLGEKMIT